MIAEPVLNALLNLFSVAAARLPSPHRDSARRQVLDYLVNHVGLADADTYLGLYDDLVDVQQAKDDPTLLANAAETAARLKPLLHGFEKTAALVRFLELSAQTAHAALPRQIAKLLGDALGLDPAVAAEIQAFIADPESAARNGGNGRALGGEKQDGFHGRFAALRLPGEDVFLVSPLGNAPIRIEVLPLAPGHCQPLRPGNVLRDQWGNELYFSHVAAAFRDGSAHGSRIRFEGQRLDYRFPGSQNGLRDFSFSERGGRMVAIMGGSGAGKSTLMDVLNGTIRPDSGSLRLNGIDLVAHPAAAEGAIGLVPQDDLLFEDLTVFENLYYAARLSMAHLPEDELARRVRALLADLGQASVADLKVGSPLQKTISGGQRKRLNIALELIREPNVLFVDEPTSGLSSSDSEIVMSLLREQAARDKLVFVVIHQPSSKIFRMFDALWVMDQGGWPIFSGTPLEAISFFRSRGALPGAGESICSQCGGVNPEQLFDIIESKTMDESGQFTRERRIPPETWRTLFLSYAADRDRSRPSAAPPKDHPPPPLESCLNRPGLWGQWKVFLARDVRARLANRAYVAIALVEPILLALLVGLVSRGAFGGTYSFHANDNAHVFFFMSVVVSLFLGLSVSAEEICRDGRILRRERFLHLSWWSYVNSKSFYLAAVAAFQMLLYSALANRIVAVPGMGLQTWTVLFAGAFCSSLLGLNVSASFRSAVTIYVLIPLLLIPQMLLCGVVIPYDDLIAPQSIRREVPRYANLLPPRWAYEALVVEQYSRNAYLRPLLAADAAVRLAEDDLDFYLPELQSRLQSISLLRQRPDPDAVARQLRLLRNEFARLAAQTALPPPLPDSVFAPDAFGPDAAQTADAFLVQARRQIFERRKAAAAERKAIEASLETAHGRDGLDALKKAHVNRAIQEQALNLRDMEPLGEARDGLYRKTLPVYRIPESRWGGAHFLAGHKRLGDRLLPTYRFNVAMIFLLSALFYLALAFRLLPRLLRKLAPP